MADELPTASTYHDAFRQRLKHLRGELHWSQAQMAKALGVSLDTYAKYETRSAFPVHLLSQLALVTHRDLGFLISGKQAAAGYTAAPE